MRRIIPTIHCCTSNEAENLGLFFLEWFQMIDRWAQPNSQIWEAECSDYAGFAKLLDKPGEIVTQ